MYGSVCLRDHVIFITESQHGQNRPEQFGIDDLHRRVRAFDDGRLEEQPVHAVNTASTGQNAATLFNRTRYLRLDVINLRRCA